MNKKPVLLFVAFIPALGLVLASTFTSLLTDVLQVNENATFGTGNTTIIINGSNGNITSNGTVQALSYYGDGSNLTGIKGFENGSIAYFKRIGLNNKIPTTEFIGFVGSLTGSSVADFNINATSSISSAFAFDMIVPPLSLSTGTVGAVGFLMNIDEKRARTGSTLLEGIRTQINKNSPVAQSSGTTSIKALNHDIGFAQNTGGTQNAYSTYTTIGAPLVLSGSPIYNIYGHYVSSAQGFDIASGTINRYGVYATGFTKGGSEDTVYGIWTDGTIRGVDFEASTGEKGISKDIYNGSCWMNFTKGLLTESDC